MPLPVPCVPHHARAIHMNLNGDTAVMRIQSPTSVMYGHTGRSPRCAGGVGLPTCPRLVPLRVQTAVARAPSLLYAHGNPPWICTQFLWESTMGIHVLISEAIACLRLPVYTPPCRPKWLTRRGVGAAASRLLR
jgi:hypothetical protein